MFTLFCWKKIDRHRAHADDRAVLELDAAFAGAAMAEMLLKSLPTHHHLLWQHKTTTPFVEA
jgi:hypothetical protein